MTALSRKLALPRPDRGTAAGVLLIAALPVLLLHRAVFAGETLFWRDVHMVWLPQAEVFVRTVASGAWPLWDPWTGFGQPLLADPRAGVLYPFTWLNLILEPAGFYTAFVVAHLALGGWGALALARHWGASPAGAALSGAVFVAAGPLLSLAVMWHHLAGAAWLPWALLAADRALAAPSARRGLVWGALMALQLFAGSPDYSLVALLALALMIVHRALAAAPAARPALVAVTATAAGLALLISAAQWLPTLEVVSRSARLEQSAAASGVWSLAPLRLAEAALPVRWSDLPLQPAAAEYLVGGRAPWLMSIYLGAPALALVLAGASRASTQRRLLLAWLAVGLLLALGRYLPSWDVLAIVPGARLFRFPVKVVVLAALAAALLAGKGLDAVRGGVPNRGLRWSGLALAGVGIVAALLAASAGLASEGLAATLVRRTAASSAAEVLGNAVVPLARGAVLATISCALLLLAQRRPVHAASAAVALAALTVGELALQHRDLHLTAPALLFQVRPELVESLSAPDFGRLFVYDYSVRTARQEAAGRDLEREWIDAYRLERMPEGWSRPASAALGVHAYLHPPTAARWGLYGSYDIDILGFQPRYLKSLVEELRETEGTPAHLRLLQMGAVSRVLALLLAPWQAQLESIPVEPGWFIHPIRAFRVPGALPRAWAVSGVRVADGAAALAEIVSGELDPARELVLATGEPIAAAPSPGTVRILELSPDRVRLEADLREPGHVVLADAFDPGWRATLDGAAVELKRANLAFRAVAAPAGRHVIELVYRPWSVSVGLALSALGIVAALVIVRSRP